MYFGIGMLKINKRLEKGVILYLDKFISIRNRSLKSVITVFRFSFHVCCLSFILYLLPLNLEGIAKMIDTPYGPVEGLDFGQYNEHFAKRSQIEYEGTEHSAGVVTNLVFSLTEENMEKKMAETTVRDKFIHFCSPCHGEKGKGDGQFFAAGVTPKPADLTNATYMGSLADNHIYSVISGGSQSVGKSNLCPPWGMTFDKIWINDMVSYVRTLSIETPEVAQIKEPTKAVESLNEPLGSGDDEGGSHPVRWIILGFATTFFIGVALYEWRLLIKKR